MPASRSANSISNRDIATLEEMLRNAEQGERGQDFRRLIPKNLSSRSANSISNRDIEMLEEMLKRNDGGMAQKTRVF
tara:strand:- start:3262 stop:3492 length:231 start_codon:yes stop_codon:yes gene_type:complete